MRSFLLVILLTLLTECVEGRVKSEGGGVLDQLTLYQNESMCERINPENLPLECFCHDKPPLGLSIECIKVFNDTFFNDTIGMKIDIDPCNPNGSRVSVDVTERDHNIDYPIIGVRAGEQQEYPIPGLSIVVPTVGHMGVDVAILILGNPDQLTLKIGLDACMAFTQYTLCASQVPGLSGILPWWVLSGTYHFSDFCEQHQAILKKDEAILKKDLAVAAALVD